MSARKWCFTSFNTEININKDLVQYYVVGREKCPNTGRQHLQGFVYMKKKARMNTVKQAINDRSAHMELARGTIADNRNYCTKDGDFEEHGEVPAEQTANGLAAAATVWEDARAAAQEGRFGDIPAGIYVRYTNNCHAIHTRHQQRPPIHQGRFENEWIYGAPGTGKTRDAMERFPNAYLKMQNKWWDGYNGEETVIIDDLHKDWVGRTALKNWADRYPCRVEYKGGSLLINPKRIIVTSNFSMDECFVEPDLSAIKRRFRGVHYLEMPH